jgi:hypothetical protein
MKKYGYSTISNNGQHLVVLGVYFQANSVMEALKKICVNCASDLTDCVYVEVVELSY